MEKINSSYGLWLKYKFEPGVSLLLPAQPDFSGKKREKKQITVRMGSGVLRVERGVCGDKATALAARPKKVAEKMHSTKISP